MHKLEITATEEGYKGRPQKKKKAKNKKKRGPLRSKKKKRDGKIIGSSGRLPIYKNGGKGKEEWSYRGRKKDGSLPIKTNSNPITRGRKGTKPAGVQQKSGGKTDNCETKKGSMFKRSKNLPSQSCGGWSWWGNRKR